MCLGVHLKDPVRRPRHLVHGSRKVTSLQHKDRPSLRLFCRQADSLVRSVRRWRLPAPCIRNRHAFPEPKPLWFGRVVSARLEDTIRRQRSILPRPGSIILVVILVVTPRYRRHVVVFHQRIKLVLAHSRPSEHPHLDVISVPVALDVLTLRLRVPKGTDATGHATHLTCQTRRAPGNMLLVLSLLAISNGHRGETFHHIIVRMWLAVVQDLELRQREQRRQWSRIQRHLRSLFHQSCGLVALR